MKLILRTVFLLLLFSCNNDTKQEETPENAQVNSALLKEIELIDSTTMVIDEIKTDIQNSTQELDEILKEL